MARLLIACKLHFVKDLNKYVSFCVQDVCTLTRPWSVRGKLPEYPTTTQSSNATEIQAFNPSKPSGYFIHHQVQHSKILSSAHTVYFCVLCCSPSKQRLFRYTVLNDWLFITGTQCVYWTVWIESLNIIQINPYPTAFPYGNGMVLHFYQQQESSTTKTVHKVINKGLKTYV